MNWSLGIAHLFVYFVPRISNPYFDCGQEFAIGQVHLSLQVVCRVRGHQGLGQGGLPQWTNQATAGLEIIFILVTFLGINNIINMNWSYRCMHLSIACLFVYSKGMYILLYQEYQIPILTVAENLQLGNYAGLCKLYAECVVNEQIKPRRA